MRTLFKPVVVLPIIAVVTAAAYVLTAATDSPQVAIDQDRFEISELVVDRSYPTPVTLTNPSGTTLEVVGVGNL